MPSGPRVLSTVANTTSTIGDGTIGDEDLAPVEDVPRAFLDGGGGEAECVRAAIRFAHGVAADERAISKGRADTFSFVPRSRCKRAE